MKLIEQTPRNSSLSEERVISAILGKFSSICECMACRKPIVRRDFNHVIYKKKDDDFIYTRCLKCWEEEKEAYENLEGYKNKDIEVHYWLAKNWKKPLDALNIP